MSGWKDWQIGEVVTEGDFQSLVQDQVVQRYADASARTSALGTAVAEGMVSYLDDTNRVEVYDGTAWTDFSGDITGVTAGTGLTGGGTAGDVTLSVDESELFTDGTAGQVVLSDGTSGLKFETGYLFRETVYFTSSGTFSKGDYPWLKAIKVKLQGGGGGSGGCGATAAGQVAMSGGGGAGGYAEKFITDIASLSASETITVGSGGAAGASGNNSGSNGGASEAFSVSADGGAGGSGGSAVSFEFQTPGQPGNGGSGFGGDLNIRGEGGVTAMAGSVQRPTTSKGGSSIFGGAARSKVSISAAGDPPLSNSFGAGATGACIRESQSANAGAAGAGGIVIVELYA